MLEHKGMRWGYVFLKSPTHLDKDDVFDVMRDAVEMYLDGERERDLKESFYEGKLYTQNKYELIGALGGQRFDAEIETNKGKDVLTFLVSEQTSGMGSYISPN
tara:strand:+ start:297 stop:605 length:309 start_codon:yes stop_codon:yes gene_type:complete